jgi:hypothetical protein
MALGDVTLHSGGEVADIELLASATATNSPPSGASAGIDTGDILRVFNTMPGTATLVLYSTAGSGTMTVTGRLWGYSSVGAGFWVPMGFGADATKGVINAASAIGETGTDTIRHAETVSLLGHFERLYFEITAIGGTSTAVTVKLVIRRGY